MNIFITVLHVLVCVVLVVVVLLQRGKGAEIGAVFGGGASGSLFGSRGAGNFLTKLTSGAAMVFMFTSFYLAYLAMSSERSSIYDADAAPPPSAAASQPSATAPAGGSGDFVEVPAAGEAEQAAPTTQGTEPPGPGSDAPSADSSGPREIPSVPTQ